ncbi:hypothetical protein [Mesorhizobium sp. B2-6-1]|uniref:hypothetical protein n=1 Tax=Mesorhizobium sp. B2-6-1 TaxID=2589916 RepID=UPI00112E0A9D|nr:hypothetical protein [Mesorhizobium sp. B2-6-1]TPJ58661.1 hypothetical protein FJ443_25460 [Mesorhizobium sp. B2-6-1]
MKTEKITNISNNKHCQCKELRTSVARSAFGIDGDEYYIDQLIKSCQFQIKQVIERKNRSSYMIRLENAVRELNTLAKNITIVTEELQATDFSPLDD